MTVSTQNNDNIFDGDGSTDQWSFTFELPSDSVGDDIYVYVIDDEGSITQITTNFTLDLNAQTITYPVTPGVSPLESGVSFLPAGWQLAVLRLEDIVQALNLTTQGAFPSAGLMLGLDKIVMILQQLQEQIDRCIKYPIGQAPTTADISTAVAAISSVFPPFTSDTYPNLLLLSAGSPTQKRWGFATDFNGGNGQLCFYTANTAVGDQGWIMVPLSFVGG